MIGVDLIIGANFGDEGKRCLDEFEHRPDYTIDYISSSPAQFRKRGSW